MRKQPSGWIREMLCEICAHLSRWGVFGDIRSAAVGSIFGAIVGLITAAFAVKPPIETFIFTNDKGFAQPMRALLTSLKDEKEKITIRFEPEDLEEVYVCEYSHVTGASPKQVLFSYLDKYSACLSVSQKDRSDFVIRPNKLSGLLVSRNGHWFCKCNF
ncbi:MAG: hypothetical protein K8H87_13410 [Pseudorhodoplanes sp.]|nr:hypothetical protein [Pseudorhodoplanes sp.]